MLVQDVMTHDPVSVIENTPVKAAIALLARHHITSMPVLTRSGRLCGVVSEADLIRDLVPTDPRAHEIPVDEDWHDRPRFVGDVMTSHAVTVHPETDLAVAVDLATSTSVKSLPVVDGRGRLVGMLSRSDVVRALARADADLAREVGAMLTAVGLADWVAEVQDGSVTLSGPDGSSDEAVARVVASTVPGVVEVHRAEAPRRDELGT
jgi:CBS domain-containing protein